MYYRHDEIRSKATRFRGSQRIYKSASALLQEGVESSASKTFSVFLSHSFQDAEIVLGLKRVLEEQGKSVYVDWIEDKGLDRLKVTTTTAAILRARMRACASLVYASSTNSVSSKWMPWELGYFDGFRPNMISILPLVEKSDLEWKGIEYLGLYPVIDRLEFGGQLYPFVVKQDRSAQRLSHFGHQDTYSWNDVQGRAT